MKSRNKSRLEIAECISLASSAAGTIVAIASQQVAYAAAPLTLAFSLSVVNRQRFQQQAHLHINKSNSELHQVVQSLHQQVQTLPTEQVDLNLITQSLRQMEQRIQMLTQQLHTQLETQETAQLKEQLDALESKLNNLLKPSKSVDLSAIETEIISLQAQLRAINPSSLNDSIALLQSHVDRINQQVENLSSPFDPSELEQQLSQLKHIHNTYNENISYLASAITSLQSDANITEQARISQLDALILKLESLPSSPEPHELSQLQDAITSLSFVNANLNDRLDNLTQQLNTQSESQLEQQVVGQVIEIQQRLDRLHAITADQDNHTQQPRNDLEQQISQLHQGISELNDRIQPPDETPKRLEKVEQLVDELEKRTIVLDEHVLSLVQLEQQIEMLQQLMLGLNLDNLQQQLANESAKRADLESILARWSEASATKQELDALTQLVVEEAERLRSAIADLPTSTLQFDPLPLTVIQQRLVKVQKSIADLDARQEALHECTRNLDQMQSQLESLQQLTVSFDERTKFSQDYTDSLGEMRQQLTRLEQLSSPDYVRMGYLDAVLDELCIELAGQVDIAVERSVTELNHLIGEIKPNYEYKLVFDRSGSRSILLDALQQTQYRLILVCPWLTDYGANSTVIQSLEALLQRNIRIDIGWGHLKDIDDGKLGKGFYYNALNSFKNLSVKYPNHCNLKLLGTHEKFLVCDRSFAMLGSHNFLTSGKQSNERELGLLTNDSRIIADLVQRFDSAKSLVSK